MFRETFWSSTPTLFVISLVETPVYTRCTDETDFIMWVWQMRSGTGSKPMSRIGTAILGIAFQFT
jgi:hypothetical protein